MLPIYRLVRTQYWEVINKTDNTLFKAVNILCPRLPPLF